MLIDAVGYNVVALDHTLLGKIPATVVSTFYHDCYVHN